MSRISNRAVICEKLLEYAKKDSQICIVTSDSRGSASLTPFANQYPDRIIEVGIAEQCRTSLCRIETICSFASLLFNNAFN